MHSVRVACGQFRAGSLSDNVAIMRDQAAEARERGARIVVFPELALTGYLPAPAVLDHCQPLDGGGVRSMRQAARQIGIAIVFGLPELTGGIRSGLSYCGARKIPQMQANAEFVKMSRAGFAESQPHDVSVA